MKFCITAQQSLPFKKIIAGAGCLAVLGFIGWNIYPIMHGPELDIASIHDAMTLDQALVTISGTARFTQDLFINGTPLALSPHGAFSKNIILAQGYNTLSISGKDRYGKTQTKNYSIVLEEDQSPVVTLLDIQ